MTKADLVKRVAQDTGMLRREVAQIVDSFLITVKEVLKDGEHIEIRGFGTFDTKMRKPRMGRNPKTEEKVPVPARRVPTFKYSRGFKVEILNCNNKK
ncbi:MAG TPA: HU family DNA-binding protein [Candidatus Cloacimonadota bacterium]|nr:HU family DNA-binding protein [Candidatus Cloacimonadota bacterium]HQB40473.1 HU family DNA-binding protein [Candidatus Cloacimonadota bacterium]